MITVLLLDLDGVLRVWDPDLTHAVEAAYELPGGTLEAAAGDRPRLEAALTGELDDRAWRESMTDELVREHGERARAAVEEWMLPAGAVDREALAVVRRARKALRVLLLTNATSRHSDDLAQLGLVDEVDGWLCSADLGLVKPDPDVFAMAALHHHVMLNQIAYVDTSASNIAAAEVLGMRSHRYEGVEGLEAFVDELLGLSVG